VMLIGRHDSPVVTKGQIIGRRVDNTSGSQLDAEQVMPEPLTMHSAKYPEIMFKNIYGERGNGD